MLAWLGANKDALLALAAIVVTPAVALLGLMLTQRNMARSLEIQAGTMATNLNIAARQLTNAERQFRLQARLAAAGIVGAIERERLDRFTLRCARLLELCEERSNKENLLEKFTDDREFMRLDREMSGIAHELKLIVPDGLASSFFATAASGLVLAAGRRGDIGQVMNAREEFIRRAREVTALWQARIAGMVEIGDEDVPAA